MNWLEFSKWSEPTKDSWPEVEELIHWKNYDFDIYEPKNSTEIAPRLEHLGIDLLQGPNPFNLFI